MLAQGDADAQGLHRVSATITHPAESETCPGPSGQQHRGLAVVARKGADMALLSNIGGIYRYGHDSYLRTSSAGHTVLDRVLFKAGETVGLLQHLQRKLTLDAAAPAPGAGKVEIRAPDGGLAATPLDLLWNASGNANSQWAIPATPKLGQYSVNVTGPDGSKHHASFQ